MTKKLLAIILVLSFITAVFTACTSANSTPGGHELVTQATTKLQTDTTNFRLSYSQSDSLNPYEADTLNNQIICELVYDSLFTLDESYEPKPNIATSYSYLDSKTLSVAIPSGIKFSDGTGLTANDVVTSFNQAASSPHWQNSLRAISSAYAKNNTTVIFNLAYSNPNAQNLLTFAISKNETDDDGYLIGSGRYKFGTGSGSVYVEKNKEHSDFNPHITKITLVNITAKESIENAVNIGNISYCYRDLSSLSNTKIKCNKKSVNLNNLVYIGMNSYSGITSNQYIRKAISLAIDRDTIAKSAYQGNAKSCESVFNGESKLGKQTSIFATTADTSAAKQAIEQSDVADEDLNITILVNKNNAKNAVAKLVKQELEEVGFDVTISKQDNETYQTYVESSAFNLYIGETKVPNDMNLNSFFTNSGATSYGIDLTDGKTATAYADYLNGDEEVGKFVLEFSNEMPFAPLVYRQGMICYSKSMHGDMQGYADNYFSNIEDWYF